MEVFDEEDLPTVGPMSRVEVWRGRRRSPGVALGEKLLHESRYVSVVIAREGTMSFPRADVEIVDRWRICGEEDRIELERVIECGAAAHEVRPAERAGLPERLPDDLEEDDGQEIPENLGERSIAMREAFNAPKKAMADRCGIPLSALSVIEKGQEAVLRSGHARKLWRYVRLLESMERGAE